MSHSAVVVVVAASFFANAMFAPVIAVSGFLRSRREKAKSKKETKKKKSNSESNSVKEDVKSDK